MERAIVHSTHVSSVAHVVIINVRQLLGQTVTVGAYDNIQSWIFRVCPGSRTDIQFGAMGGVTRCVM